MKSQYRLFFAAAQCALALGACAQSSKQSLWINHTCVDANDSRIPADMLDKARHLNVAFGHESVGWNMIQGLEELAQANPRRFSLTIGHNLEAWWYSRNQGFGEFFLHNNGNVPGKAEVFETKLTSGIADRVNAASLKLCFADLQPRVDADEAFRTYTDVMERMQKQYPKVTFIYWTVPLRVETMLEEKRTRFNNLMRSYAQSHKIVLFDVADIESTGPDGTKSKLANGSPCLYQGYSQDGGHLNAAGRERVARAWWWMMAQLAGWNPNPR